MNRSTTIRAASPLFQQYLRRLAASVVSAATIAAVISVAAIVLCSDVLHAETPTEHNHRMAWWRDARFGMFVHWGLYAIPAGVWKGKDVKICATGSRLFLSIPTAEWDPLIHQFDPVWYNPRDWAKMAKAAGMKYAVLTAKHHEGFCLFDSKLTDFTSMHAPIHRDLVREWLDAFRAEGIRVGLYYSLIDWHHPEYPVVGDSLHPERERPEARAVKRDLNKYLDYMHGQVRELMTNYGKIDILWFDYSYDKMSGETWRATQLMKMVRSLQPEIIVNNRLQTMVGNSLGPIGDFVTPEQTIPPGGIPGTDWETCMTMNDTWGYKSRDHNWKSTETLVRNLVDIASKGGNYLLNVGPTAEGVVPEASVNRLTHIGRWMHVHGESIYGTSASPFPAQLPWGRCTRKILPDGTTRLYLHVFDWPKDAIQVPRPQGRPVHAFLLADPHHAPLVCHDDDKRLTIKLPAVQPDPYDSVVVVDLQP